MPVVCGAEPGTKMTNKNKIRLALALSMVVHPAHWLDYCTGK